MATVNKGIERLIARMPEVKAEVLAEAESRAAVARGALSRHRRTGEHDITVTHGRVDAFVSLEGVAPGAVNYGHFDHDRWVEGIHVIEQAMG